ncbi:MAG: HAD-IA family hydrolase [Acidimicrobiales bacterium]|nr:HAD-IA family hydrolase [Acidimicrobiales bacterium]
MISAVLFDFGGVILSSPFDAFNVYEAEVGLAKDTIRTINATNPDDNAWARFERGDLDPAGFVEVFEREARALGHEVDARRVLDSLRGHVRPEMVEALRRCGERFKTACLTNNFRDPSPGGPAEDRAHEMATIMALFDEVVESSVVGVRKPEPRFYEIACERLGVEPDACVFLDDLGVNLKPARAMGMTTIKVMDPAVALAELEAVVGIPLR